MLVTLIPGMRAVDAGSIEMSRICESMTALLISLNRRYKTRHSGIRITGIK
jgi:predicted dinucleotide-binding enzyme